MEKTYIIKLTDDELSNVCYILDRGWNYLVDTDFFDSVTEKDEYFAAFEKVYFANPVMVPLMVPFSSEDKARIKQAAKEQGFMNSNEFILHVVFENLKKLRN